MPGRVVSAGPCKGWGVRACESSRGACGRARGAPMPPKTFMASCMSRVDLRPMWPAVASVGEMWGLERTALMGEPAEGGCM